MTNTPTNVPYRIARRAGQQGARCPASNQAGSDKHTTGRLLQCKTPLKISTFNIRTSNYERNLHELTELAEENNIDIICIQEHKIYHNDIELRYKQINAWTLITSSAEKNSANASIGGVGMLMSPKAYKALNSMSKICPRIIKANFNGNPVTTVISCYSPTNCSDDRTRTSFYSNLTYTIKSIPNHNVKIIAGDMNAKVGPNYARFSHNKHTNENGELLINMTEECNLEILNTRFQKPAGKLWTFSCPNKSKKQIDYILINRKWRNSAMNCEAYNSFATINSDHRIVTAKVRLSLRANKRNKVNNRFDWSTLISDNNVQKDYLINIQNSFELLTTSDEEQTAETIYESIISAHEKTSTACIPKKTSAKKYTTKNDEKINLLRGEAKSAWKTFQAQQTKQNYDNLKQAREKLYTAYCNHQENYIQTQIQTIESAAIQNQTKLAWKTVNEISSRKISHKGRLNGETSTERTQQWEEYFKHLLGQLPKSSDSTIMKIIPNELPISTEKFTLAELSIAIQSLSNNKACGLDNIPAEIWKIGALKEPLLKVCNGILNGEKSPALWRKSAIIPIPKKGNLSVPQNYRGISLTSTAAKVFNKMILNRLKPHLETVLRKNQNGFRPGRSTIGQILTLTH